MSRFPKNDYLTSYEEFGLEVHEGWVPICEKIIEQVDQYNRNRRLEDQIEIFQIKSKFGELRVYLDDYNGQTVRPPGLIDFIEECENECSRTCEWCGSKENVSTSSYKGWIRTLCDKCNNKLREEKQ